MNELGKLLKAARGDRTLREMAETTGVSHTYLGLLEKGVDPRNGKKIEPSVEILRKVSESYQVPFGTLMIAAGYWESDLSEIDLVVTPELQSFAENFLKLTPEKKKELLNYGKYLFNMFEKDNKE